MVWLLHETLEINHLHIQWIQFFGGGDFDFRNQLFHRLFVFFLRSTALFEIYSHVTNYCANNNFFTIFNDVSVAQQFPLFIINIFTAVSYCHITQEGLVKFMPWAIFCA